MLSDALFLLILHSLLRWLVFASLGAAIYRGFTGYFKNRVFTETDDALRHWTATIAHIQLVVGLLLYNQSPVVKYFRRNFSEAIYQPDTFFFGLIHITLMVIAVVILTIGSAKAKRRLSDKEKFKTMLTWFLIALLIIFIAIPWPFSPLANRPYIRSF
jgi:hypothetical protein